MTTRVGKMPVQTWPKNTKLYLNRRRKTEPSPTRPETATLEKPLVLDPRLLQKLDMTKLTKDKLITIQNLILSPRLKDNKSSEPSTYDEDSLLIDEPKVKRFSKGLNTTYRVRSNVRKGLGDLFPSSSNASTDGNGVKKLEKAPKELTKKKDKTKKIQKQIKRAPSKEILPSVTQTVIPPVPCCTCGRPEQPERLHSHPAPVIKNPKLKSPKAINEQDNHPATAPAILITPSKSSVQKPNPIKYRSLRTPENEEERKPNVVARRETFKIEPRKDFNPKLTASKRKGSNIPVIRRPSNSSTISPNSLSPSPSKTITPIQTTSPMKRSPVASPTKVPGPVIKEERNTSGSRRPRTMVCHICMREFGTASLPLHEPHCLQRWERENSLLPPHLRRSPPKKPDRLLTPDEWNEFAYNAAQATLVPCEKCGRTFQPDRLPIHHKACIGTKISSTAVLYSAPPPKASVVLCEKCGRTFQPDRLPIHIKACIGTKRSITTVDSSTPSSKVYLRSSARQKNHSNFPEKELCYLCGLMFSSDSLSNHEEACLAKWQHENDKLPQEMQRPLPLKERDDPTPSSATTQSYQRKRMAVCYICGREFGSASIRIHEPQCLKKWKIENGKLPPEKRRSEPKKPEIVYTSDGIIDIAATDEVFWQSHLVQLVPCSKCKRTFNPDRVAVHEKACKGIQHKH